MAKKRVNVEIVVEGEKRFVVTAYADGTTEGEQIVTLPRKPRYPPRPYWNWSFDRTKKRGL